MRRALLILVSVAAALVATAPAGAATTVTPRVVGGQPTSSTQVPWQVLLYATRPDGATIMCGGTLRDDTHVVTAAHCVSGVTLSTIVVYAGIEDTANRKTSDKRSVDLVQIHPQYDATYLKYDAALLTLHSPYEDSEKIQPVPLASETDDEGLGAFTDLLVSGWGRTDAYDPGQSPPTGTPSQFLRSAVLHPAVGCTKYAGWDAALQLCAGQAGKDACQGDSGGPLVVGAPAGPKLVGIVSGGLGCASEGYPGAYTRVAAESIRSFLATGLNEAVPVNTDAPVLAGQPAVGQPLVCNTGTWSGAQSYRYRFLANGAEVQPRSSSNTFVPGDTAVGASITCEVRARSAGPSTSATSAPVGPVTAPAPPVVLPPPPPPPVVYAQRDTAAPVAKLTKVRCGRKVCVLDVSFKDPLPSSGLRTVTATVTFKRRATCKVKGRPRSCLKTSTRRLKTKPTGPTTFRVSSGTLPAGTATFKLVAVDGAGNRQARATTSSRRLRR
jgi:hypothetical protein